MALFILRCVFLMVAVALGYQWVTSGLLIGEGKEQWLPWLAFLGVILGAVGVLTADIAIRRKRLDTISAVLLRHHYWPVSDECISIGPLAC